jgi:hypothetical protein
MMTNLPMVRDYIAAHNSREWRSTPTQANGTVNGAESPVAETSAEHAPIDACARALSAMLTDLEA